MSRLELIFLRQIETGWKDMSIQIICGSQQVEKKPLVPYSDIVCDFLDEFSSALRKDTEAKAYPDVLTFAFWARKGNIQKKKQEFLNRQKNRVCIGKGIVFHIAPSNVPVNCMFTYAFGLLAGNSNIVRIPTKTFPQVECMCRVLNQVLENKEFAVIKQMTSIVRYDRAKEITDSYSKMCNMRVIWGGDETIAEIRKSELPPRSTEITFADRYSFGMIDVDKWLNAGDNEKKAIVEGFYNDTFLMDQNACSTPHVILWNNRNSYTVEQVENAKNVFWNRVNEVAKKYQLADIKVSEKYALLCEQSMRMTEISKVEKYDNLLYICDLSELPIGIMESCRGKYGLFYNYVMEDYDCLDVFDNEKVQTCAYYGDCREEIVEYIVGKGFCGIDRVVSFGKTLDIDTTWDGYDLVSQMSRLIG